MSKTYFTPGPWEHDGMGIKVFADKMKMNVCDIRGMGYLTSKNCAELPESEAIEVQKANAALIAAAPEMYEALESLTRHVDKDGAGTVLMVDLAHALDVLKKARGEE